MLIINFFEALNINLFRLTGIGEMLKEFSPSLKGENENDINRYFSSICIKLSTKKLPTSVNIFFSFSII